MKEKFTIEKIRKIFADKGCEVLDDSFQSSKDPINYKCQCGNVSSIRVHAFLKGGRCRECGAKKISQKRAITYAEVKQTIEEAGYELISKECPSASTKIEMKCPEGHEISMLYYNFKSGSRCRHCFFNGLKKPKPPKLRPTPKKHTYESVKINLANNGYALLSKEYKKMENKLDMVCPKGHEISMRYSTFCQGARCRQCSYENMKGENNPRWRSDKEQMQKDRRFGGICRRFVRRSLNAINEGKKNKTYKYLKYTPKELKEHFENHPKMEQFKKTCEVWVPDHIFPIKAFVDYGITDIAVINALDNLQPLSESENHIKGDSYNTVEFEKYLKNKGQL